MASAIQEHITHAPGMDEAASRLAEGLQAATVEVRAHGHGNGSGVIWDSNGLIITNNHVLHGDNLEVVLRDGRAFPARILDRDPDRDLASLHVGAEGLPAARIGDSSILRVGQLVMAMGNPLGVKSAMTVGIIHAVATAEGTTGEGRWIRADLSLLPGNSGGPLVDAAGRVIGINSMVAGGLALAIPSNTVTRFVKGQTRPAFLGVQTQPVSFPAGFAAGAGLRQESGLLVLTVIEGGPAARNGLLPGDILVEAGGQTLTDHASLLDVLRGSSAGTPLPLKLVRGGSALDATAILGEREKEAR